MKKILIIFITFSFVLIPIDILSQRSKRGKTVSPKKREKQLRKAEKKKEKEIRKAKEAGEKRHLDIQDKKVRRRLKRNKRRSNRKKRRRLFTFSNKIDAIIIKK